MAKKTTKEGIENDRKSSFNFFDIVGFDARREEDYSDVLAWLFDPEGEHGFGTAVLESILEKLGIAFTDVEYEVNTEKNYEGRRLDIAVDSKEWHIVFENKIRANALNDEKLLDEYKKAKNATAEGKEFALVFLYPKRLKPYREIHVKELINEPDAYEFTWRELAQVLKEKADKAQSEETKIFVSHFAEHLSEVDSMDFKPESIINYARIINSYNETKHAMKKSLDFYLNYFMREISDDEELTKWELKIDRIREERGWTPYAKYIYVDAGMFKDVRFWLQVFVNEEKEEFGQYIGISLPGIADEELGEKLEKAIKHKNETGEIETWTPKNEEYYHVNVYFPFEPNDWQKSVSQAVKIFKMCIATVGDFLKTNTQ